MIYISDNVLSDWNYFEPGEIVKYEGVIYYVGDVLRGDVGDEDTDVKLACIKLIDNNYRSYNLKFVNLTVNRHYYLDEITERIVFEEGLNDINLKGSILIDFFNLFSREENVQNVMFDADIFDLLKEFSIDPYYSYSEEDMLFCEFMNIFKLQGKAVEGYYEGNLVLTNVELINKSTGQVIKSFDNINLASNFYCEDNDVDYMIECYLESLSKNDIIDLFSETGLNLVS